jgi:hypothetical protein
MIRNEGEHNMGKTLKIVNHFHPHPGRSQIVAMRLSHQPPNRHAEARPPSGVDASGKAIGALDVACEGRRTTQCVDEGVERPTVRLAV